MKVRIRVRIGGQATEAEILPFSGIANWRVPRPLMLMSSVALHIFMVLMVAAISRELSAWMKDDELDWSKYQAEPLRLHLLQPLIYQGSGVDRQKALASGTRGRVPARGARAPRRPYLPNPLELPANHEAARNMPVILQPENRPQAEPPPAPLPPLAFWARESASASKPPAPKGVLVPGRTEPDSVAPDLSSTPAAAVPNREQSAADLNVSLSKVQSTRVPALPLKNSSTNPVRLQEQVGVRAASFEQFAGQPANVLVMAGPRPDIADVRIPRGLQNLPPPAGADDSKGIGSLARSLSNGTAGASSAGTDRTTARPVGPTATSASSNHYDGHMTSLTSGPRDSRTVREEPGRPAEPMPARKPDSKGVTRIAHPPKGSFDVVIMQSTSGDDHLSETAAILTGSPVYTVYLQVGDRREWLLEYCLPARENSGISANREQANDSPITPPYPISTAIPNDVLAETITSRLVIHCFLTAAGSLRDIVAPNTKSVLTGRILALLDEWRFRPALRKDEPVELEVLLIIPARS